MRAPDPGFQHAAAPHRYARRLSDVVNALRLRESADPAELDVDDLARTHLDRLVRLVRRPDAFIETDRR